MLGFTEPSTPAENAGAGVQHIPLVFDMPMDDWRKVTRADLVFPEVPHVGLSYEVRVFFNNKKADHNTARTAAEGYAGRFVVFGHGDCFGGDGHCSPSGAMPRSGAVSSVTALEHPAAPHKRLLTVTEAVERVLKRYRKGIHTLTLVATSKTPRRSDRGPLDTPVQLGKVSLQVYT